MPDIKLNPGLTRRVRYDSDGTATVEWGVSVVCGRCVGSVLAALEEGAVAEAEHQARSEIVNRLYGPFVAPLYNAIHQMREASGHRCADEALDTSQLEALLAAIEDCREGE